MVQAGIIVGGPCGTGKTSVGRIISEKYNIPFIEGDELHPKTNVEKMANGIPLTDEDRWDWLKDIATTIGEKSSTTSQQMAVASCSSLTKRYRDYLREHCPIRLIFIFLWDTEEELTKRVTSRKDHYMGSSMVTSQVSLMEVPEEGEVDCYPYQTSKPLDPLSTEILDDLQSKILV